MRPDLNPEASSGDLLLPALGDCICVARPLKLPKNQLPKILFALILF